MTFGWKYGRLWRGRALDCTRCNANAPSAACSCLINCGATGCTGETRKEGD